jgi:hypothetical protein
VKTTTDKLGRWCRPHKSTFRNDITVVVDDLEGERTTGWLAISERCVYVHHRNGDGFHVVEAPCMSPPRRTEVDPQVTDHSTGRYSLTPFPISTESLGTNSDHMGHRPREAVT